MSYCQLTIIVVFLVYYVRALRQYSRWLLDNFSDLEHKEVWKSLTVMVVLFAVYALYTTNGGELYREVMGQVSSLVIFGFLVWRVETLKDLTPPSPSSQSATIDVLQACESHNPAVSSADEQSAGSHDGTASSTNSIKILGDNEDAIAALLRIHCEEPQLYLRYDLTLDELSEAVGVGKNALSEWFAEHYSHPSDGRLQGKSFNTYINSLRIDHFVMFYSEAGRDNSSKSIYELATQCGYRNYESFSNAFRQRMGCSVAVWLNTH